MFTVVTNLVNYLVTIIQWIFLLTSSLGQVIVTILTIIYLLLLKSAQNIVLFFRIIYEDNFTIIADMPKITIEIVDFFVIHWLQVQNYFRAVCYYVEDNIKVVIGIVNLLSKEVLLFASDSIFFFKKTLIFLGETLWLVLTFIPLQVPQLLEEIWYIIKNCVCYYAYEGYIYLLKCTNFLSDVPLQSFIGLIMTMIIVRLCVHFRDILRSVLISLYWLIIRKVLYLCYVVYNYFNDYDTQLIAQMFGQQLTPRQDDVGTNYQDISNAADALCVICQERPKCVLTLPCRHVCLCTECCMRLYGYQRTCPICRTFIYHSVTVYL